MKYAGIIFGVMGVIAGAVGGYYYAKKKTTNEYEADIASIKEEYQKKIEEARSAGRKEIIDAMGEDADGEKQKLRPNGDIDDETVEVVSDNEAIEHTMEDVVYFAKDKVWYNQDKEETYDKKRVFSVPADLFSYFGPDKADLIYLHNTETDEYFSLRYNNGSYVTNVLGYDSSDD